LPFLKSTRCTTVSRGEGTDPTLTAEVTCTLGAQVLPVSTVPALIANSKTGAARTAEWTNGIVISESHHAAANT
jgi:hypothetical protein